MKLAPTRMRQSLAALCVLLCSACTTNLTVKRVDPKLPGSMVGAPYPLMFTRYQVDVTRQVSACGPQIKILSKVDVKAEEAAPDSRQLFVIDTNSLASPVKTGEVKLSYSPSGAVTSLNASAEDRSAQVVAGVVGAAVKMVTLAAAAGGLPNQACNQAVLDALDTIKKQKPRVEAATRVAEAHTDELKQLTKKAATLGDKVDAGTRKRMGDTYEALTKAQGDLDEEQTLLDQALKVVRDVQTVYWPEHGDQAQGVLALPPYLLSRWGSIDKNPGTLAKQSLYFQLSPIDPQGRPTAAGQPQGQSLPVAFETEIVDPALGVPYRLPAAGRLQICQGQPCGGSEPAAVDKVGAILQLGRIYYLPCESRAFTSIGCTFEMTDAGQLKSMGSSQKAAAAEGVAGALKDAATQLSTARKESIEAKTALAKAKADYAAAVAAPVADPLKPDKDATAALNAQVDLIKAQVAKLEAEQALRDAQVRFAQP